MNNLLGGITMAEIQPHVLKTLRPDETLQKVNQGKRRTYTFQVDFHEYNPKFVGSFVVHHPSQMERLQVGVIKAQLLGGVVPLDTMTDNIAQIISTLDVVIDSKPAWFDVFDDELDYDILEAVYLEYINWVNTFRRRTEAESDKGNSEKSEG
jgi:hypothetical protein